MERLASFSVDLDEIDCYTSIHGIDTAASSAAHAVYDRGLPRFEEFFASRKMPATFFAIGRDLARQENASAARRLVSGGHEIGNHSLNHLYDLTRRETAEIAAEIEGGIAAIERATGTRPRGFRAPGYTVTDAVFRVLETLEVTYDSSVFPCPSYYAAKAMALSWIRLRGRKSRSILDTPRVLSAPSSPYRGGNHYWQKGSGVIELPIGVTDGLTLRLPYIGTSLLLAGPRVARAMTRRIMKRPWVHLELHGIDLCDAELDGLAFLRAHQPDLRRSLEHKLSVLRAVTEELERGGYTFVTLSEVAALVG